MSEIVVPGNHASMISSTPLMSIPNEILFGAFYYTGPTSLPEPQNFTQGTVGIRVPVNSNRESERVLARRQPAGQRRLEMLALCSEQDRQFLAKMRKNREISRLTRNSENSQRFASSPVE